MLRWIRGHRRAEARSAPAPASARRCRIDRRRSPRLEGLEGRQLLSDAGPTITSAVASPTPPTPAPAQSPEAPPVVFRHTPLPTLRAWATQPFDGIVASFVANSRIPPEHLAASIDWGDGQVSPGTVEPSAWGGFNVRGAHTYGPDVSGMAWIRVDVADARTGQWLVGVEQRVTVGRPSIGRMALYSAGYQPASAQVQQVDRAQPARLKFVERRQRYHESADRYSQGTASADDIRYLRQVRDFQEQQKKGFFEELGDNFVKTVPFT